MPPPSHQSSPPENLKTALVKSLMALAIEHDFINTGFALGIHLYFSLFNQLKSLYQTLI